VVDLVNVALVKLSALGDVVHAMPVAAALRERWPSARLTWIVEGRLAPLLDRHPALDDVITVDTRTWRRARRPGEMTAVARDVLRLFRRLRSSHFDIALDLQGLVKSGVLARATCAPVRIGFARGWRPETRLNACFTNRRVMPPASARHVVDQYLALLAPLGSAPTTEARFDLPIDPGADDVVDRFFRASGVTAGDRVVMLNPGAGRDAKLWAPARFAELGRALADERLGRVIVLWGPGEEPRARSIVESIGGSHTLLAPPTDLVTLIALLRRATVVVSADSGPLHLAAAVGISCVGLYGPTSASRNGPYGRSHRTLEGRDGTMAAIDAGTVLGAVRDMLDRAVAGRS
jgi:lipopolysaccharide heptosyltransferase I